MERIGKYEIVRHLASGGMGEVLLARQSGPGGFARAVVVKRLLPHLAKEPAFVQMFLNEARVVSRLSHPNVAQIYELGESGDTLFIAMEFVHGRSLQQVMRALADRQRLLGPPLTARMVIQALQGLHHAHSLRIDGKLSPVVHRDMSPDNILIGFNGTARVIDFGIARAADTVSTTRTGTVKGKFAYMAPERFDGERAREADATIDVYAMGVVAYEGLTGRRPFRGGSDAALVGAILNSEATPAHEVNPAVPPELSAIVGRALAKDLKSRYPSASDFAAALESWLVSAGHSVGENEISAVMRGLFGAEADTNPALSTAPSSAMPSPPLEAPAEAPTDSAERPQPRSKTPVAAAALVLLAGLVTAGWFAITPAKVPEPVVVTAPPPLRAPPDPAKPVTAVVVTGKPGRVSFRVKPWGEIWLDGVKLGTTPNVKVERPPGLYTFTVKNPSYPPRELPVQVLPDSDLSVKVDLTTPD